MKLRVNGLLTDCYTGDRMLFITPPMKPLPRVLNMENFKARIYHEGQVKSPTLCSKCLAQGHHASTCTKEVVCRKCSKAGHKAYECKQQTGGDEIPSMRETQMSDRCDGKPRAQPIQKTRDTSMDSNADDSARDLISDHFQSNRSLRNRKEAPKSQAKITQFISAERASDRENASQRDSESDGDSESDSEDANTLEVEEEYSDMSADSPKLPEDGKKFASAKRSRRTDDYVEC
ncbi:zinc finger CCHC domain-containing protein 10-like [Lytechinus variegatus]|uniref:zinc finger CCHC domain-containing protein 10-like n=1 Tax=Lytechinus variegatus TaxID=7654 RepID=UPI001BB2171D|nr:zinc finger CCHC domain-containing protein 10-like [Lytechinus variegatus]